MTLWDFFLLSLFFFFESESLLFLLIGQLEKLVPAYLLEWKDSITEPQEQALAESCSKETWKDTVAVKSPGTWRSVNHWSQYEMLKTEKESNLF